ncbi:MAG: GNAT family N-acetyltransferase [Bacillota bacterium]
MLPESDTLPPMTAPAGLPLTMRRATPADRDAVLAISAHYENNWLPYVIDGVLRDRRGGLYVAEWREDDRPGRVVAVAHAAVKGDEAWLEAMRVDPGFVGRGVATALTVWMMERCRENGCRWVGLATEVTNAPVHRLIGGKLGFREMGRWVWFDDISDFEAFSTELGPDAAPDAPPGAGRDAAPDAAPDAPPGAGRDAAPDAARVSRGSPEDVPEVWDFLNGRKAAGLVRPEGLVGQAVSPWRLEKLTRARLSRHARAGRLLVSRERPGGAGTPVDGFALLSLFPRSSFVPGGPGWASLFYLEGDAPATGALLAAVLREIRACGSIGVLILSLPGTQAKRLPAVTRSGWPPGGQAMEAVIYQKDLGESLPE